VWLLLEDVKKISISPALLYSSADSHFHQIPMPRYALQGLITRRFTSSAPQLRSAMHCFQKRIPTARKSFLLEVAAISCAEAGPYICRSDLAGVHRVRMQHTFSVQSKLSPLYSLASNVPDRAVSMDQPEEKFLPVSVCVCMQQCDHDSSHLSRLLIDARKIYS
jgi:hypothetical protein